MLSALWTSYYKGEGDDRERCVTCSAPIADGLKVRVYAHGLEHSLCWMRRKLPVHDPAGPVAVRSPARLQ